MTLGEQVKAVAALGFTERQARFLTTVMRHAGVCLPRQYCTFGGIARGQKTHDFFARLVTRRHATAYTGGHGRATVYHVHNKALYRAIGETDSRFRKHLAVDHVIADRDLQWLAGEREKVEFFTRTTSLRPGELPSLTFGHGTDTTTRYFPDKLPIGVSADGRRHVFLYLVTQEVPLDFRAFLHRQGELLRALAEWEIRVITPGALADSRPLYEEAFRDELAHPHPLSVVDELAWYFRELRSQPTRDGDRLRADRRQFAAPRYRSLYRAWRRDGDRVLHATASPILADALARRTGRLECRVPAHRYVHLTPLVGSSDRGAGGNKWGNRA
jgi:hypothetical protein